MGRRWFSGALGQWVAAGFLGLWVNGPQLVFWGFGTMGCWIWVGGSFGFLGLWASGNVDR